MFSAHSRLRHAVADTFAMVVYCTVVNMMIEIFLSGMTFEQSLSSYRYRMWWRYTQIPYWFRHSRKVIRSPAEE